MKRVFGTIETAIVDTQALLQVFAGYKKPREAILNRVKSGDLIRLKNGLYLINDRITSGNETVIPYEQIANLLYGPSYVSMEWALSFYGMIPERVHGVTSMTLGRHKEYQTPVGDFCYYPLSANRYSIGVGLKKSADFVGGFFIATPEKALADWVFKTCNDLNKEDLKKELLESKRMSQEQLRELDKELLNHIAKAYRAKSVDTLTEVIGLI
ncbi:MAG: hypothetical protein KDK62_05665 [Chlamydiia bacterium]|nr:hypothetical protein [Chlamydiia bacterium]